MESKRALVLASVLLFSLLANHLTSGTLNADERSALVLLIVAAGLWTSEVVPLTATSLLIPLLQSLLGIQSFKAALSPFFDPVVMLLLGGFLLAIAVEKNDIDEYFAHEIISRVRADSRVVVLVLMLTTAFLSMWISNTASTALMLTMALRMTERVRDERGNFSKILVLGIAYSATVGGLSTLVGTTTCAMAAGFLKELIGYEITFLGWMFFGLPVALLMILVIWLVLFILFPTDVRQIEDIGFERKELSRKQKLTLIVFVSSILLWLSGRLPEPIALAIGWPGHGLSSSVVAAIIAVLLLFTGLIGEMDIPRANWSVLLLIGGGLSLGGALEASGLVGRISEALRYFTGGGSNLVIIALMAVFSLGISIVASNTASAGIFLPIAIGLGASTGVGPVILAVVVGISTSLDFMLPVGTPPNAIAYSTGRVTMLEMIKSGLILDLVGAVIVITLAYLLWPLLV
ncbi:MAG: DASS family sodium-coupled anion symporter [Candidatus Bathyarchaeota archaeon]|nr:MAG: DASS family sodium-coupled anion symporter [Candidatus Bathyarchaeota archaeon]